MDDAAVRLVTKHYGRHANNGTTQQALQKRREGPALPLKRFHNHIKERLINRFCFGVEKVLDLCCGRGGDIHKWDRSKVRYVKGIDVSKEEIEEAKRRFSEYVSPLDGIESRMEFESSDVLGRGLYEDPSSPYNVVTCFFALHYFMVSHEAVSNLFLNATNNLKLGGFFICTCPDGKRVLTALTKSPDKKKLQTPMLTIVPRWQGPYECFGSPFTCSITDTVTEGVADVDGSYEYLVFTTPLKHIAAKHGLRLICDYEDEVLDRLLDKADAKSEFKHFHPRFPRSHPSLAMASSLNMAFVFQKVTEVQKDSPSHTLEEIEAFETKLPPLRTTSPDDKVSLAKRKTKDASCEPIRRRELDLKKPRVHVDEKNDDKSAQTKEGVDPRMSTDTMLTNETTVSGAAAGLPTEEQRDEDAEVDANRRMTRSTMDEEDDVHDNPEMASTEEPRPSSGGESTLETKETLERKAVGREDQGTTTGSSTLIEAKNNKSTDLASDAADKNRLNNKREPSIATTELNGINRRRALASP